MSIEATQTTVDNKPLYRSGQKPTVEVEGLSFSDLFEAINPLNHLPVVSQFWGEETADNALMPLTKLAGSFLLGGPLGLAVSAAETVYQAAKGETMGRSVISQFTGSEDSPPSREYAARSISDIANAHKHYSFATAAAMREQASSNASSLVA